MKEQLYTLLNEMDNQADSYESSQVSELELKKWKKQFSVRHTRRRSPVKYVAAAAVAVCIMGTTLFFPPTQTLVYAGMKSVTYNLSQLLGIQKDLSPYRTVVGGTISKDGFTVTLNDVVLDENLLYISDTLTVPEKIENFAGNGAATCDVNVFINGKMASWGASGGMEQADDYNLISSRRIALEPVDSTESLDMELRYSVDGKAIGSFSFAATGKELLEDTFTASLDTEVSLPDQTTLKFYKYSSNAMGQKIYFKFTTERMDYDIVLKGTDNLGNPVEFSLRTVNDHIGCMEVDTLKNGYIRDEAESLTLTPYIAKMPEESGQMSSDFQPVGESFTVMTK